MKSFYVFLIMNKKEKKYRLKQVEASTVFEALESAYPQEILDKAKKIVCAPIDFDFEDFKKDLQQQIEKGE